MARSTRKPIVATDNITPVVDPLHQDFVDTATSAASDVIVTEDNTEDIDAQDEPEATTESNGASPKQAVRNKALLKLEQVDYDKGTDVFFEKLNSVFNTLDTNEARTRELFNLYFLWLDDAEIREIEAEEAKLLAQLKALRQRKGK
jgi:hypothetical protein